MDAVLGLLGDVMASPWVYPVLFGICLLDAVVPVFPSEAPLILAGVYAGSTGRPNVLLVLTAAFAGGFIGDHLAYLLGRALAPRLERVDLDSRGGRAVTGARDLLDRRGGMALVVARFIPWGRIATTLVLGATRYPRAVFTRWDAVGVGLWALHGCLLGYLGGAAFQHDPIKGLVLGIVLALAVSALIEGGRWALTRRRRPAPVGAGEPVADPAGELATDPS